MAETEPLSFFVKLDGPSGPMWQERCEAFWASCGGEKILILKFPKGTSMEEMYRMQNCVEN